MLDKPVFKFLFTCVRVCLPVCVSVDNSEDNVRCHFSIAILFVFFIYFFNLETESFTGLESPD